MTFSDISRIRRRWSNRIGLLAPNNVGNKSRANGRRLRFHDANDADLVPKSSPMESP